MSAPTWDEDWLRQHMWPRFSRALARDEIYLANHSLGRPPDRAAADMQRGIDAWYRDMDGAWDLWLATREQWRATAVELVCAPRGGLIYPENRRRPEPGAGVNPFTDPPRPLMDNAEVESPHV